MAVSPGHDFAMVRKTTWVFSSGVADATAIVTPEHLFIFPHKAIGNRGDTTYTIGGQHPLQAIDALVSDVETTRESLDEKMLKWSSEVEGPIVEPMTDFKRVRIFTGWIRRSVVFSKKDKGFEFAATSVRPSKAELQHWVDIFKDHPGLEMK
ncbi:MAG: hypothetical protein ACYTDT_09140 [Planctomycetota bacterium]|jgi:hypothetical protein